MVINVEFWNSISRHSLVRDLDSVENCNALGHWRDLTQYLISRKPSASVVPAYSEILRFE